MVYSDIPPTIQSKQALYLEPPQRGDASSSYNRRKRRTKVRDTIVRGLVLLTCTGAVALSYYSCRSCEVISIHNYHPNATNLDLPDFLALTEASDTVFISPFGYAPQEDSYCEYYYQTLTPTSWKKGAKKGDGLQTVEGNLQIGNQGWDMSFVLAQISSLITPVFGTIAWLLVVYSQCRSWCATQTIQPRDRIIFEDDYAAEIETTRASSSLLDCMLLRFIVDGMNRMDNFVNLSIFFVIVALMQMGLFLMTFQTNLCHDDIGRQCQLEYFGRLAWVAFALYILCAIALLAPSLIACIQLLEDNDNGGRGRYRPGLTTSRRYYDNEDDPDYHSNLYNHRNDGSDSDHGDDPDFKFDHQHAAPRNSKRSSISMLRGLLDGSNKQRNVHSPDVATEARRYSDSTPGSEFLFYVSDAAAGGEGDTEDDTSSQSSKRVKRKTLSRVSSYRNKNKRSSKIDRKHSTRNFSDDDKSIDA